MIRPILPPQQMWEIIFRLYEENPALLFGIGAGVVLLLSLLGFFLIREVRKSPTTVESEGGET